VYLGHADRSRIVDDAVRRRLFNDGLSRPVLIDGFIEASWRLTRDGEATTLLIEPFRWLSRNDAAAVVEEGGRLLRFVAGDADAHEVEIIARRSPSARP